MGMRRSKMRQQLRDKVHSREGRLREKKGKTRTDEDEEKNKINLKLQFVSRIMVVLAMIEKFSKACGMVIFKCPQFWC